MLLVVMRDLVHGTKILDAAKRLNVPATMVDESVAPFAAKNASGVLIDFNDARLKPLLVLEELRRLRPEVPIVGICGHTNTALIAAARAGGCEVLTNAEFAARLDELVKKYGNPGA